ncbi:PhnD/SsuA/transferrin family substrate-binding protein [Phenylobacterium sp.]|uniref:phosphate/phosphite/phosphonate ABC transporter substrate-binding protein n=1 Tax=Phenylobacterium sp. TaxID=1871053 RepID=UPI0025FBD247|nr:PhnD/SsuA/transferrin family substrate-binding protein [Phenylobacterium sp.]
MIALLLAAQLAAAPPPLKVATYAYPKYDRAAALKPMAEQLGAALGRETQMVLLETPDALAAAIAAGEVDIAMTNLAAYLAVRLDPKVQAVAVLDVPAATAERYRGVLVARRGAGVAAMSDLPGTAARLRYAEVLPGSTSGALVQAAALRQAGLTPGRFKEVRQAGTHEAALAALQAGTADLAAFAEEPWRKLKAENPQAAAGLVELWRSAPLPAGPVVCVRAATTPCDEIGAVLQGDGAAAAELAKGWSETEGAVRFRSYDSALYQRFDLPNQ